METARFLFCVICFGFIGRSDVFNGDMLKELFPFSAELYNDGKPWVTSTFRSSMSYWLGSLYNERTRALLEGPRKCYRRLVPIAEAELWVREKTGRNDGKRVEEYLHCVGLHKGDPYCAAFVSWVFKQAGYAAPRTGWSPALFPSRLLVKASAPGNVFGIYFPTLKRIGHCGFVEWMRGSWLGTIEGNTGISGGRDGDGVYRRMRHKRSIKAFANWR